MVKSIIKEIIVILLLLLAIVLALGVLFYDYIPTNKTVPSVATYTTTESIKAELDEQITEEEKVLVTYEITAGDLSNLQQTKTYDKGKANPFSTYQEATPTQGEGEDGTGSSITTNPSTSTTKSETFYDSNKGTK